MWTPRSLFRKGGGGAKVGNKEKLRSFAGRNGLILEIIPIARDTFVSIILICSANVKFWSSINPRYLELETFSIGTLL